MPANLKNFSQYILFIFLINSTLFAIPSYKMSIEEVEVLDDSTVQASVYIENVGEELVLTSYQCALSINQNIDLESLTLSYVEGSSELLNEPNLYFGIENIDGPTELTFVSYIGNDIITQKTRVGTFILQGNLDLSDINILDIQWDFEGTVSTIITGEDFVNITNPANHESVFSTDDTPQEATSLTVIDVIASNGSSTAMRVVDGLGFQDDDNSRWAQQGMPASLIFDLGEKSVISKTRFSFFHFIEGRIYQYNVKISDDMENWTTVLEEVDSEPKEWSENEFSPVEGRYVELEILSSTGPNNEQWATVWEVEIHGVNSTTDVEGEEEEELVDNEEIPNEYGISQNYPNPFNPSTKVQVKMKESGSVRLDVYNLLGERVLAVLDEELTSGIHEVSIDGSDLASGIYIYQLNVNNQFSQIKKMNLIK